MSDRDGPATRPLVVINADDLGLSAEMNDAILESFRRGLITSASIMTNMPGFTDAARLVRDGGFADRIGVHLNLTDGVPLTDAIRRLPSLTGPTGRLMPRRGSTWRLARDESAAIEEELIAQVDAAVAAGLAPSHLDSHHHVHTQWPIGSIVIGVAEARHIPMVRLARDCGPIATRKRLYKSVFNGRLRRHGLAGTAHFGSAADAATLAGSSGPIEIMVHPRFDPSRRLVDGTAGAGPLEAAADRWRDAGRLVGYRDLRPASPTAAGDPRAR
jgi:hypothetical protein